MQPSTEQSERESVVEDVTDPKPARRSAKAMFFALFVIMVPVLAVVGVLRMIGDSHVQRVDISVALDNARAAHARGDDSMVVLEPAGLGEDWAPVSAEYRDRTLRIGYVTPAGAGVQVVQSAKPYDEVAQRELGESQELRGAQTIGLLTWQVLRVHDGETALVLAEPERTIIVLGRAEVAELTELAASLRA